MKLPKKTHNKFINDRPSGWTVKSAASQQRGPLLKALGVRMESNLVRTKVTTDDDCEDAKADLA